MPTNRQKLCQIQQDGSKEYGKVAYWRFEVVAMAHDLRCEITSYDMSEKEIDSLPMDLLSTRAYKDARVKYDTYRQAEWVFVGLRDSDGWICKK